MDRNNNIHVEVTNSALFTDAGYFRKYFAEEFEKDYITTKGKILGVIGVRILKNNDWKKHIQLLKLLDKVEKTDIPDAPKTGFWTYEIDENKEGFSLVLRELEMDIEERIYPSGDETPNYVEPITFAESGMVLDEELIIE